MSFDRGSGMGHVLKMFHENFSLSLWILWHSLSEGLRILQG
jgi:hypothetical protein